MNTRNKTKALLLQACGSAAIALGIAGLSTSAQAQAFQATPNVVQGSAVIDRATPGVDTVTVIGLDAVIDWTPDEDINGDALTFLPNGNTAIFQSQPGDPIFGVINRILPATNGNVTVMNGAVISQLQQLSGPPVPGGFVMFYSSTGLVIGSTATFDVGGLVLTTLAPDIASFTQFVTGGGSIAFNGVVNDTSAVQIDPGATITGTLDGSALAVVAPQILMSGTVDMNGSVAYVAAQDATLAYADGLFDIIIPTGTVVGTAIVHDGITGGPASTGFTDNHVIYGVTQAQTNPVTMLFSGDLGFQPAINATTDNGDIILSANYDVLGRGLAGGTAGGDTFFDGTNETSNVQADIFILDAATITSRITAVGTHTTSMQATTGGSLNVTGDVTLVGRTAADIFALDGNDINIDGNVLVSARNFAPVVGTVGQPGELDATGGTAQILANNADIFITGDVEVNARATSGVATIDLIGGSGQAGFANASALNNGLLDIGGNLVVRAFASPFQLPGLNIGGDQIGGVATVTAFDDGQLFVAGDLTAEAYGAGLNTTGTAVTQVSNAIGGTVTIGATEGATTGTSSRVDIAGSVFASANGSAGSGGPVGGAGGTGTAGSSVMLAQDSGATTVLGSVTLDATGNGGENDQGIGGDAIGGQAQAFVQTGGAIDIDLNFTSFANGIAGDGISGGNAFGGASGIVSNIGDILIFGNAFAAAAGQGGDASFGFGGNGGDGTGGLATIESQGNLVDNATLEIAGNASVFAAGQGGLGGAGDGSTITPGNGGNAFAGSIAIPLAFNPSFSGGAFVLAGGDHGTTTIGGQTNLNASASGGRGGTAGTGQLGGAGGDATGGDGRIGTFGAGGDGSIAAGSLNAGTVIVNANAFAGDGGFDNLITASTGPGGTGTGGSALVQARFAPVSLGNVTLAGSGFGGDGSTGGDGFGDQAGMFISNAQGGSISVGNLTGFADGNGGEGTDGNGGDGTAGDAFVGFQGGAITVSGTTQLNATGTGGAATNGNGGTGTGGIADLADFSGVTGSGTFLGTATLTANGFGGEAFSNGFTGGTGNGGTAYLQTLTGSSLNAATAFATARGRGGDAVGGNGGIGIGGSAYTIADGTGALIDADLIRADAGAIGGNTATGTGGNAQGGLSHFTADNGGVITVVGDAVANTTVTAGDGVTGGDATGGDSFALARDNGSIAVGNLDINANAGTAASSGGAIEGGITEVFATGPSALTAVSAVMSANAEGAAGGTATGGSATLATETSGLTGTGAINIGTMVFEVSGTGAASNFAGDFDVGALNGTIVFQDLIGAALGPDGAGDTSSLEANGFDIAITNSGLIDSDGDLEFITGNGGLIVGGTGPTDLTASFDFRTSGLISIIGDNDNLTSFGALSMILESSDIDIPLGARFGAVDLTFFSNNTAHGAVIGGTTDENGWTMTQDEAARIEATNVSFDGPQTLGGDPYDVEVRDLTIFGSLDDGVSSVSLFSGGTLGIVGQVDYQFAGPGDLLQIFAAERIDVLVDVVSGGPTGGAIFMTNANDDLSGTIDMFAPSIFAVMPGTLSQLLSDPEFSGLADILATEQGFSEPQAFIAADTVSLFAEDYIYTQNWGANGIFSGVAVGPGGFTLQQDGDTLPNLLNAIVYGVQVNGLNDLTTNSDFFQITTFNMTPSNHFTSSSTLNNCLIVDGTCGGATSGTEGEVEEVVEVVTTSEYTTPPTPVTAEAAAMVEESETDSSFGLDFPSLFNPPTVQEQGTVRDPVTSGGDSAAYADSGEDEEEGTQDDL